MSTPRQLVVGCGFHRQGDDWLHADLNPTEATDLTFDLQQPWPLDANCMETVLASHVLEHLDDFRTFFAEAWRVLEPGGLLYVRVPNGIGPWAHWDVSHVRPWVKESFCFLQPQYHLACGNAQHQGWGCPFDVQMIDVRLSKQVIQTLRWHWLRKLLLPYVEHLVMAVEELFVSLRPLKTPEAIQRWAALNQPGVIRCQYVGWQHHLERRTPAEGEPLALVPLGVGCALNGYA